MARCGPSRTYTRNSTLMNFTPCKYFWHGVYKATGRALIRLMPQIKIKVDGPPAADLDPPEDPPDRWTRTAAFRWQGTRYILPPR